MNRRGGGVRRSDGRGGAQYPSKSVPSSEFTYSEVHMGDYSITFTVDENILVVAEIQLGHRRNVCEH